MRWPWKRKKTAPTKATFVADIEWQRTEELRPERMGPSADDVENLIPYVDPWRPSRTLGPFK